MAGTDIINMWPDEVADFMNATHESQYILLDVRQPEEYSQEHIPGAVHIPLPAIGERLGEISQTKDIIVYCRSGARSKTAALILADSPLSFKGIVNMPGGILAWENKLLSHQPKTELFEPAGTLSEMLMQAMALEKGAFEFYDQVCLLYPDISFSDLLHEIRDAERGHARLVYQYLTRAVTGLQGFDSVYSDLPADITEGGRTVADLLYELGQNNNSNDVAVIDAALELEHAAFDLYRVMAEQSTDDDMRAFFLDMAQAEKRHIKRLAHALA